MSLLRHAARRKLLKDADVDISKRTTRKRKDSPSGTRDACREILEAVRGRDVPCTRSAHREVVGDHTVAFERPTSGSERSHRAIDARHFARAFRAAKWVVGRKAGLYDMQDVLGLKESSTIGLW